MRLMIFAQYPGGHHPHHVAALVEQWHRGPWRGVLDMVFAPRFAARHADVIARVRSARDTTTWIVPGERDPGRHHPDTLPGGTPKTNVPAWAAAWWDVLDDAARERGADHMLILNIDVLASAATRARRDYSAIVVKPPANVDSPRGRDIVAALGNPRLNHLFFHDADAAAWFDHPGRVVALPLPEGGAPAAPEQAVARAELGIDAGRRVILFFGHADARKGIGHAIRAIAALPEAMRHALAFVIAGEPDPMLADMIMAGIINLRAGGVQVRADLEFVPDSRVAIYFAAADMVLAPHQDHPGMSAVMLRAAAFGRPIVTQRGGLIGRLVRDHALGLGVDTADPAQIASATRQILAGSAAFDPARARAFAGHHDPAAFASTIFDRIFGHVA